MSTKSSPQPGPKVLRIGVVVDGKIAHERLIRPGEDVSLGESARNTFVLPPDSGLPKRTLLFAKRRGGWSLRFTREMTGKLAHKKGVVPLDALHGLATEKSGALNLPLEEGARGKVQVSERVAVLFQFVPAPPEPAALRTSGNFRPRLLEDDDPVYLGFLGMFSTAAAVGMIWVWNQPPIQHIDIEDVTARLQPQVMMVQPVEPPPEIEELELVEEDGTPTERDDAVDPNATPPPGDPEPIFASDNPRTQRELTEQLIAENPVLTELLLIRTRGDKNSGNAGEDGLFGAEVTHQGLDEALDGLKAEDWTSTKIVVQGCVDCEGDVDIELGTLRTEIVTVDEVMTKDPVPTTPRLGTPQGPETPHASVASAVRRQSVQLKRCHELALNRSPSAGGRMVVAFTVTGGHTELVEVVTNATGDSLFSSCVAERVEQWKFDGNIEQDVMYPFVFGESN
ncbi:MAG: AgmX/PglI C-terminal domain-containing protein [Proteobacteria bacterium]|nr:AgmX/PglI C-terminal domain-containing protein [Pseudomonadota bacterium]MCP4921476.1 AgmX/PglI C-terminal domain-containing protein [Pseudomonadota bacterium]